MTADQVRIREQELADVRARTLALIKQTDPVLHDLRVQLGVAAVLVERLNDAVEEREHS